MPISRAAAVHHAAAAERDDRAPSGPTPRRPTGPSGGSRLLGLWLAALSAVVVLAVAGKALGPPPVPPPPAQASGNPATERPPTPTATAGTVAQPTQTGVVIPHATLDRPATGAALLGTGRLPVRGTVVGTVQHVWVTVLSSGYLLGQADLPVGRGGRFAGTVEFLPPVAAQAAQVRVIDPGPPPRLMLLRPLQLGTTASALLLSAPPSALRSGQRLRLSGLVRASARAVQATLAPLTGASATRATARLQPRWNDGANPYLGLWRAFDVSIVVPPAPPCTTFDLDVTATGITRARDVTRIPLPGAGACRASPGPEAPTPSAAATSR